MPSNWELQGFGTYNYGHDVNKAAEQGRYRHTFTVPAAWASRRIRIVFEGSMTDTQVAINGKFAGPKHHGAFYRFKYDITNLLNYGSDNLLEVTVSKQSSNPSVNSAEREADYWVFGGIYRPVYIEAVPAQFIDRTAVDARADGTFLIDVHLKHITTADNITAQIVETNDSRLGGPFSAKIGAGQDKVTLRTKVHGHKRWTAETPSLYTVKLTLCAGEVPIHTVTERFGFRTIEVRKGEGMFLNGRKIRLKGVNRHCFWPDSGRTLSQEISYADARLIKQMNMNAVRMSHYPPDVHFLDACDELGLYVLDELAGWQTAYDTEVGRKLVKEMVIRDVSHPCVLFWDNGNEGGWNTELDAEYAKYDPQNRVVLHPWENFNRIDTKHYVGYKTLKEKLNGSTIFMPTEFLHGLYDGGHGAGLEDYWNLMRSSPLGAGGFLWALIDEGVVRTDKNGQIDVDGNHAPDGILGPYREKEGSFYAIKEIWSPVFIGLEELPADFAGQIEVENRYDFTNLNECSFSWKLVKFPKPQDDSTSYTVLGRAIIASPSIAPGNRGVLNLDLPDDWRKGDALYLTATDPYGQEICTWVSKIKRPADYYAEYVKKEGGRVKAREDRTYLFVEAGGLELRFSKNTGLLENVRNKGKAISFGNGPRLLMGRSRFQNLLYSKEGDTYVVEAEYTGNFDYARWTIDPSGRVKLSYQYELKGRLDILGITFDYPQSKMKKMKWLGKGPYRVWKNRTKGSRLGVWSSECKDHVPGVTWHFPEFRGYYADFNWVVLIHRKAKSPPLQRRTTFS